MDFDLPAAFAGHPGPQFGIAGSRRLMGVAQGPMIASIIKPSLRLSPEDTAPGVQTLCEARVDVIKDDEKLMSPAYWPLSSADPDRMMRDHDHVFRRGGNAAVINIGSIGPGAMAFLRRRSALRLHAHRDGGDILTRHPALGMEYRVWQKIWRLPGVD